MIGILFGGQGSQQIEMGKDFYENLEYSKNYYDSLDENLKNTILFGDLETLTETKNTQPALVAFQTMIGNLLKEENINIDATAGLSIGEYSSLAFADIITSKEAIEIATIRGKLMDEIGKEIKSKMVAILGGDIEIIKSHINKVNDKENFVEISNINCPGQIVVSGEESKIDEFVESIKDDVKRIIPLKTSGAFHTSYMNPVEDSLKNLFEDYEFKKENKIIPFNYLGRPLKEDENIKEIMSKQVSNTVLFQESIEYLIDNGVDTFIEVGFGNVLKGFIKKIDRNKNVYVIDTLESYYNFIEEVKND